jgi:molecular chaperone DnaK
MILEQLPRATSSAARPANLLRTPLGSSFVRRYADDADKKVRGPVIGIDLGKSRPLWLKEKI